jgi:hypothetical protein
VDVDWIDTSPRQDKIRGHRVHCQNRAKVSARGCAEATPGKLIDIQKLNRHKLGLAELARIIDYPDAGRGPNKSREYISVQESHPVVGTANSKNAI